MAIPIIFGAMLPSIFATLFAAPLRAKGGEWDKQSYVDSNQARKLYSDQLDVYYRLMDQAPDKFRLVRSALELDSVLKAWSASDEQQTNPPVGLVPLMEGGDAIRSLDELPEWWERGVRIIGPAWMSTRFCGGTREPGPLTKEGHSLLEAMSEIGFTLDLSHMDRKSAQKALDIYDGSIIASHSNALRQVKDGDSNRFLDDEIIERIVEHDGVIGVVPLTASLFRPGRILTRVKPVLWIWWLHKLITSAKKQEMRGMSVLAPISTAVLDFSKFLPA